MKKVLAGTAAAVLALTLAACGAQAEYDDDDRRGGYSNDCGDDD